MNVDLGQRRVPVRAYLNMHQSMREPTAESVHTFQCGVTPWRQTVAVAAEVQYTGHHMMHGDAETIIQAALIHYCVSRALQSSATNR